MLLRLFLLVQVVVAVQVSMKNGRLKGELVRNGPGKDYYAFRFIPYAKSINSTFGSILSQNLNYPQRIGNWSGVRDTTIGSPSNSSTNETQGSEHYLYLSVFTRKIKRWLPPALVRTYRVSPVEVYFRGSSWNQTKSESILNKDVVKVLVNHGEISSSSGERDDMVAKAQLLALEWIKDNIQFFGGDPEKVTLFQGHSGLAGFDINRLSIPAR